MVCYMLSCLVFVDSFHTVARSKQPQSWNTRGYNKSQSFWTSIGVSQIVDRRLQNNYQATSTYNFHAFRRPSAAFARLAVPSVVHRWEQNYRQEVPHSWTYCACGTHGSHKEINSNRNGLPLIAKYRTISWWNNFDGGSRIIANASERLEHQPF